MFDNDRAVAVLLSLLLLLSCCCHCCCRCLIIVWSFSGHCVIVWLSTGWQLWRREIIRQKIIRQSFCHCLECSLCHRDLRTRHFRHSKHHVTATTNNNMQACPHWSTHKIADMQYIFPSWHGCDDMLKKNDLFEKNPFLVQRCSGHRSVILLFLQRRNDVFQCTCSHCHLWSGPRMGIWRFCCCCLLLNNQWDYNN